MGKLTTCPTEKQWRRFWLSMKRLGVWEWAEQYATDEQMQAGSAVWFVEIVHGDRRLRSCGTSIHPETYDVFCRAVARLAQERLA